MKDKTVSISSFKSYWVKIKTNRHRCLISKKKRIKMKAVSALNLIKMKEKRKK